jgi:hypothetical protein
MALSHSMIVGSYCITQFKTATRACLGSLKGGRYQLRHEVR